MKESYLKTIIIGVLVTVTGGVIVAYLTGVLWPSFGTSPPPANHTSNEPRRVPQLNINYQMSGRFHILGPNPDDGVWASPPGAGNPQIWYSMEAFVSNGCNEPVFINANYFRLYLASQPSTEGAQAFQPTNEGMEYQTRRIPSAWLAPGDQTSGSLYFRVPQRLQDGGDAYMGSVYSTLRYTGSVGCRIEYSPR